ncbi:50S ribosomal protein L6 [Candidatus Nitrosoglobus terrae]|uniref:Large ribosomal subunit protein uL6 n=1 Tax=Candidatus Nitrosoglobus terrae TaxID=1630141 RepID=A0A1Q2SLN7_9GAMM|nr:50S ribosomal protein L6 [Candidatus Nitrosoglobus terrae]BAW80044.1 50S ribosomal protein L6 [Candidatus Nitrosoglobus terrae]
MSRVANNPVLIPEGVEVSVSENDIKVKGVKGSLSLPIHKLVQITQKERTLNFLPKKLGKHAEALSGTFRSLVNNMVRGVNQGFEERLQLVGVGYRAQIQGKKLLLNLGYSHPIEFIVPIGLTVETPSPTDVIVKGADKRQVGQAAANIRNFRVPEPYKGKGIRYTSEIIVRKEAKKK